MYIIVNEVHPNGRYVLTEENESGTYADIDTAFRDAVAYAIKYNNPDIIVYTVSPFRPVTGQMWNGARRCPECYGGVLSTDSECVNCGEPSTNG